MVCGTRNKKGSSKIEFPGYHKVLNCLLDPFNMRVSASSLRFQELKSDRFILPNQGGLRILKDKGFRTEKGTI